MKRFEFRILLLPSLLFLTLLAYAQPNLQTLHVKVDRNWAKHVKPTPPQGRTNYARTGLTHLDKIHEKYKVTSFKRIFRESPRFRNAHKAYELDLWYEVTTENSNADLVARDYQTQPGITKVERVIPFQLEGDHPPLQSSEIIPNDPSFSTQWHYRNIGQSGGTPGADIKLSKAWTLTTGSQNVIVAIVDTGVDFNHPDLSPAKWINENEIAANGIDDDGNGYVDDLHGYGFGDDTPGIFPKNHGTHVAGTVGAVSNNGVGVSGIAGGLDGAGGVRLMSCAVFGRFSNGGFADAFVYAADNGAVIAQNSWGGGSSAVEAAIDYFIDRAGMDNTNENFDKNIQIGPMAGGIVIFAAGNANTSSTSAGYPASYHKVIAVASTDHRDIKSSFSNYGSWVDISAPGSNVFSTFVSNQGSYGFLSGTSMACPHVSGAAALIVSRFGNQITPTEVRQRLTGTADNIEAKNPSYKGLLGAGRLNAYHALLEDTGVPLFPINDLNISAVGLNTVTLTWTSPFGPSDQSFATSYEVRYQTTPIDENNFSQAILVTGSPKPSPPGSTEIFQVKNLVANTKYYFAIKTIDFFGNVSPTSNVIASNQFNSGVIHAAPGSLGFSFYTGESQSAVVTITNNGTGILHIEPSIIESESTTALSVKKRDLPTKSISYPYSQTEFSPPTRPTSTRKQKFSLTQVTSNVIFGVNAHSSELVSIDSESGEPVGSIALPFTASGGPDGLAFDGTSIYFVNGFQHPLTIKKFNPTTAEFEGEFILPGFVQNLDGLAHNGHFLYAANYASGEIYEIDFEAGSIGRTFTFDFSFGGGFTCAGTKGTFFVSDFENRIHKFDISSQSIKNSFSTDERVFGLAYSAHRNELFAALENKIVVYDVNGNKLRTLTTTSVSALAAHEAEVNSWATIDQGERSIYPGESVEVTVTINSSQLQAGSYPKNLLIESSDPEKPQTLIPIQLTVASAPAISISASAIDFGIIFINQNYSYTLQIENTGTESLLISEISTDNQDVSISFDPVALDPGDYINLPITFSTSNPGELLSELTINSNDPGTPTMNVQIRGSVKIPPVAAVSVAQLEFDLYTGENESQHIEIQNTGGSDLFYQLSPVHQLPATTDDQLPVGRNIGFGLTNSYTLLADLSQQNFSVQTLPSAPTESVLKTTQIVVLDDLVSFYSDSEIEELREWISYGGRLILTINNSEAHQKANEILLGTGISIASVDPFNEMVIPTTPQSPFNGITEVGWINGSSVLAVDNNEKITIIDSQSRPLAATSTFGEGVVMVFSNSLFNDSQLLQYQNRQLSQAVFNWSAEPPLWLEIPIAAGSVPPGGAAQIEIVANAVSLWQGTYNASLQFTTNAPDAETELIPVSMQVTNAADILLSVPALSYPATFIGATAVKYITITNFGTDILDLEALEVTAPFATTTTPTDLQPGETVAVEITFAPSRTGQLEGTFVISSNDPDEPELIIPLSGSGASPPIISCPDEIVKEFMPDASGWVALPITNNGVSDLIWSLSSIEFLTDEADNCLRPLSTNGAIEGGQQRTVLFFLNTKDLTVGVYEAIIHLTSNDPINPNKSIPVTVNVLPFQHPVVLTTIDDLLMTTPESLSWDLLFFEDPDGHALVYSVSSTSESVQAVINNNQLVLNATTKGTATITVSATDDFGGNSFFEFDVNVKNPNQAPIIRSQVDDFSLKIDSTVSLSLSDHFLDPENETISYTFSTSKEEVAAIVINNGRINFTGLQEGSLPVLITATDPEGLSATVNFILTVEKNNLPPRLIKTLANQRLEIDFETMSLALNEYFEDASDSLSFDVVFSEPLASFQFDQNGLLNVIPLLPGSTTTTITATDSQGLTATASFTLDVFKNFPPVVIQSLQDIELMKDETFVISLDNVFSDPDGDNLEFNITSSEANILTFEVEQGTLQLVSKNAGKTQISVTATDKRNQLAYSGFTITVNEITGLEANGGFLIYPNPFKDLIGIQLLKEDILNEVYLIDSQGRRLELPIQHKRNSKSHVIELNTQTLASGRYILKLVINGHPQISSILKY